jgi:hypothetical protein
MTLEELVKEMGEQHRSITHTIDTVRSKTRRGFLGEVRHTSRMSTSHPWGGRVEKLKEIEDLVGWTKLGRIS